MPRTLSIALLAAVLAASGCGKGEPWTYTTPDGQFSFTLPGSHSSVEEKTQVEQGITIRWYMVENTRWTVEAYCMMWFRMPEGSDMGRTDEKILADAVNGGMRSMGGTLKEPEYFDFGGYAALQGQYYALRNNVNFYGRVCAYMLGDIVAVQMCFGRDSDAKTDPDGVAFMESFQWNGTP